MTLLITNEEMDELDIHPGDVIEVVERAFRDVAEGRAPIPARRRMYVPDGSDGPVYWVNNIMGAAPSSGTAAVRLDSVFSRVLDDGHHRRRVREGDFSGLVILYSMDTAEPLAIMHDHYLSTRRVGATTAIGVKHMSREDARVLGIFGSGHQAVEQVRAICAIRPIDTVKVFSPNAVRRAAFVDGMRAHVEARLVAVDEPAEAIRGCDIVCTATSSRSPVFDGQDLEPGTHVVTIVGSDRETAGTEIDQTAVLRMDRIVTNLKEQIVVDGQPKLLPLIEAGDLVWEDIAELHEVVGGTAAGRLSQDELTLHDNNTGMGLQFASMGRLIYDKAMEAGIGSDIDTELLMTRGGNYAP